MELFDGTKFHGFDINDFFETIYYRKIKKIWFHNLKFDGTFIINHALKYGFYNDCLIDGNTGTWYNIKLNFGFTCEIRDSLKKYVDSSVEDIARIFKIEGKTSWNDYDRYREVGYIPTKEEIEYCYQDTHIITIAMKNDMEQGHTKLTLASDCFVDLKKRIVFDKWYPKIARHIDESIRPALKGGCTYLNPKYANEELDNIWVFDETSEYPSVTVRKPLPFGIPFIRDDPEDNLYVVKFKTDFELKKGMMPTLQIKGNFRFTPTEFLTSSNGQVELILTSVDYELFKKHYHVYYEYDHEYTCFESKVGIQSPYVNYWYYKKVKAGLDKLDYEYWIAKIRCNNSWGKLTSNPQHVNMIPYLDEFNNLKFIKEITEGEPIYLPHGLFVTAWARKELIDCCQMNYNDFVYCDTDSIHCLRKPKLNKDSKKLPIEDDIVNLLNEYGKDRYDAKYVLGAWKHEHPNFNFFPKIDFFPKGKYLKQKMYMHADENYIPYREYENSLTGEPYKIRHHKSDILKCEIKGSGLTDDVKDNLTWEDFKLGYQTKHLKKKNVQGGCYLELRDYTIT